MRPEKDIIIIIIIATPVRAPTTSSRAQPEQANQPLLIFASCRVLNTNSTEAVGSMFGLSLPSSSSSSSYSPLLNISDDTLCGNYLHAHARGYGVRTVLLMNVSPG